MTKTCQQCGAVLPSSVRVCNFCDSSFSVASASWGESLDTESARDCSIHSVAVSAESKRAVEHLAKAADPEQKATWQGELAQRVEAYRTRRRKTAPNIAQSEFTFDDSAGRVPPTASVAVADAPAAVEEDFSFTIAIGRPSRKRVLEDAHMVIDVSQPANPETPLDVPIAVNDAKSQPGLHPVASIDDRRLAGLVDFCCLLFAYGGFLMLFGSLGGQFTLSKLSAAVYTATFAIVYLQYFALFTIFGGTTPGMMMRGLQVVSFSGEPPTPRQMLLRAAGYVLSAGTFFLGFLWTMWDEDELTWHDRLSRTYLSVAETFVDIDSSSVAHGR